MRTASTATAAKWLTVLGVSVEFLAACATATTRYTGVPVAQLSDEQLVEELVSAAEGLGVAIDRTMYLIAARPEPAYVLTSSTSTFRGTINTTYSAYSMPVGYGVHTAGRANSTVRGSTSTRYHYTDVNAAARLGSVIATAMSRARETAYRRRGEEVWTEYHTRVESRRIQMEQIVDSFFKANPDMQSKRMLVAAVAPWVAAEGRGNPTTTLDLSAHIVRTLPRGEGSSGTWYGLFSQTTQTQQGETFSFSEFVQLDLVEDSGKITGKGSLGSGELIELSGRVSGSTLSGAVANTTSAINVSITGVAAANQITGEFSGSGAGQRMNGTFVLLR